MKSVLNEYIKNRPTLVLLLLGLNFLAIAPKAHGDLPNPNTLKPDPRPQPLSIPRAKSIWRPRMAPGKPPPYQAGGSQGVTVIKGNGKSTIISGKPWQQKTAPGKPFYDPSSASAASSEQMVLQSRDISAYGPVWQSFSDYLNVPKGCDKIPLFLTFTNGSGSSPRFQDIRIKLAGKSLATLKDFPGGTKLTRNLTNAIGTGDSLLLVQTYGPAGARMSWRFTTPKVEVTGVSPKDVGLNKPITITGKNFSDQASVNQVYFDKVAVPVTTATRTQLQVKVPATLAGGKADITVAVGPSKSKPFRIAVKSAPKLGAINMISTAPGQPLTISGEGFSTNSAENQVTIGGLPAQIISSSPSSITVIVPEPPDEGYPTWGVPIKVKTNGVDSVDPDNKATINIQSRVFDNSSSR